MSGNTFDFSVVIPTYSRPNDLARCLESLTGQDYPRERFEVLVSDDESYPPAADVCRAFENRMNVRVERHARAGPAVARNRGATRASGRWLAFIDDDCSADPGWLRCLERGLVSAPGAAVGGHTMNAVTGDLFAEATQAIVDYLYDVSNLIPQRAGFLNGNNLALPLDDFHAVGGFRGSLSRPGGEERLFLRRWLEEGRVSIFLPEAKVFHHHRLDLRSYWSQHINYGMGAAILRRHASAEQRSVMPKPDYYLHLLVSPFARHRVVKAAALSALIMLAQVATLAGSVSVTRRHAGI